MVILSDFCLELRHACHYGSEQLVAYIFPIKHNPRWGKPSLILLPPHNTDGLCGSVRQSGLLPPFYGGPKVFVLEGGVVFPSTLVVQGRHCSTLLFSTSSSSFLAMSLSLSWWYDTSEPKIDGRTILKGV